MKEITILSGKGGAGKTIVTAALASVAPNALFCDNDVDAADLHLIFQPDVLETHTFDSGKVATINADLCTNCGLCEDSCRFTAIHKNKNNSPEVNPFQCEGCRLCERICPANAITTTQNLNNEWFISSTRFGTLVHAKMGPGEENSGKLVTKIRERAKEIASEIRADFIINDGPPGIGCTAISSITGTDAVLLVIEPTVSGLHDAKRVIKLINSFEVPVFAAINKFDINPAFTTTVEDFLRENKIPLVGKIPFTELMVESMIEQKTVVEYAPENTISKTFFEIWAAIS
ncbi:P-loop NTPase [Prolixibacteraceae bacterium Z1-6]|uniref:P-loop NTPase n=1 Tax=Draconibacterium aestuarii TaxID=2998507 RepID=A0A9X3FBA2_9BACT|nr:P-loop NTPase [Prolixibacteraceae bacterium Z1-6]